MPDDIQRMLATSPLMAGLDPALLGKIATAATPRRLRKGEILFRQGDRADAVWGVLDGSVTERVTGTEGKEFFLAAHEPGAIFGIVSTLDWGPRRAEAVAREETRLFCLRRRHFLGYLQSSPELCFRIFAHICEGLRHSTGAPEETVLYKLETRLAKILLDLQPVAEGNGGAKSFPVLHLKQADLARRLGVNREAVNRHLRKWENDGLLTLGRQKLQLLNDDVLRDLARPLHNRSAGNGFQTTTHADLLPFEGALEPEARDLLINGPAGIMALKVGKYLSLLSDDAAGTLAKLNGLLKRVDSTVRGGGGHLVGQVGDQMVAVFPDGEAALRCALLLRSRNDAAKDNRSSAGPDVNIGVHAGQVVAGPERVLGEAVQTAMRLSSLAEGGEIYLSDTLADEARTGFDLDLTFLGQHDLLENGENLAVYSTGDIAWKTRLYLYGRSWLSRRHSVQRLAGATAIVVLVLLLGVYRLGTDQGFDGAPPLSVAVLPFTLLAESEQAYLADGITTDLRAALARLPGFQVTGAESSAYFKDGETPAREIGQALGVAYLLMGVAGSAGDEVHVKTRLVDVATGKEVWQVTYDRPFEDLMEVERDILHGAGATINGGSVDGQELGAAIVLSEDADARALYMRARHLEKDGMQDSALEAIRLAQQAVARDPEFADAYAFLAKTYMGLPPGDPRWGKTPEETHALAEEALERARSIRPNSPMVLAAGSRLAREAGDAKTARRLAEQALALNPNDPDALMGLYLDYYDRDDRRSVENTLRKLLKVDPLAKRWIMVMGSFLVSTGRYDEARVVIQRGLSYFPDFAPFHANISAIALHEGKLVAALRANAKGRPYGQNLRLWFGLDGGDLDAIRPRVRALGGYVYQGDFDAARRILDEDYASSRDSLEFLVLDGHLESLMGNYAAAVLSFDAARMKLADGDEGQLIAARTYAARVSWERQTFPAVALLHAYRKLGRDAEGDKIAALIEKTLNDLRRRATGRGAQADDLYLYVEAQFHAIDGRTDEALETLRRWKDRNPRIFTYIERDPYFEPLHGKLRFQQIVAEVDAELAKVRMEYLASLGDEPV